MSLGPEADGGPPAIHLTLLDGVAIATREKEYMESVLHTWKNSGQYITKDLLEFQLHTAKFIHDHAGWVIINDTEPIIDTFLRIIAFGEFMGGDAAEYLVSAILKGKFERNDQNRLDEKRYQTSIASTATIVGKLWETGAISILQARQWIFFQHWMQMERAFRQEIGFPRSQISFPEAWPICIEGRSIYTTEISNIQPLPSINTWYKPANISENTKEGSPSENQTPIVASVAAVTQGASEGDKYQPAEPDAASKDWTPRTEQLTTQTAPGNDPEEDSDTEDHDKNPTSLGNSPKPSEAETRRYEREVSNKSQTPPIRPKRAPRRSARTTKQRGRIEKDKDLGKSPPPKGGRRGRITGTVSGGGLRGRGARGSVANRSGGEASSSVANRSGPGSSAENPLIFDI
ncbi:hypothetical protein TWF481_002804 [Arthrobotrys musiformis]|uniref:Uncharacterized protein n=1 Tax=Arthrobotrys musiformis TaxID=47236 RepID=A0AAV9VU65_9PEZI